MSPSSGKRHFLPDLRLLGKVSINSIPSPICSARYDEKMTNPILSRMGALKSEPIEIHFDPHEFLNAEESEKIDKEKR